VRRIGCLLLFCCSFPRGGKESDISGKCRDERLEMEGVARKEEKGWKAELVREVTACVVCHRPPKSTSDEAALTLMIVTARDRGLRETKETKRRLLPNDNT
jgi:hypothetical protein